jgi:DNA-binding NtrC family response regulator
MRVLLVDDETELVSALAERLEIRGIEAKYVCRGQQALELAPGGRFDLAVLDMKMPGIAGLKLKAQLQSLCPEMKFIFMTGYGSDQVIDDIRKDRESNVFLVKPVDIDELIEAMQKILPEVKKPEEKREDS